jgi:hypothetical protein
MIELNPREICGPWTSDGVFIQLLLYLCYDEEKERAGRYGRRHQMNVAQKSDPGQCDG